MKPILRLLTGRVARNLYLWIFALYLRLSYFNFRYSITELGYLFLFMFLLAGAIYANTLILVPRLGTRKKIHFYIPAVLSLIVAYSFIASKCIFLLNQYHPEILLFKVAWAPMAGSELPEFKIYFGSVVVFSVFLFTFFTFSWFTLDHTRKNKELRKVKKIQAETELNFLKNQLNPHFLFNTLNNIYGMCLLKPEEAPELVLKLSTILRYLLYESNKPLVSFRDEMVLMQAIIDLELLRFQQKDIFVFEIECDKTDYIIPPLLWLPVLENIFKYGKSVAPGGVNIFRCVIQENLLHIYSSNFFEEQEVNKTRGSSYGIGLSNLKKRLEILYPSHYGLEAGQVSNEFIVDIQIEIA